jgi:hypothetical protein
MPALAHAPTREKPAYLRKKPAYLRSAESAGPGPRPEGTLHARPTAARPLDMLMPAERRDWTSLPEAAALLADCAANPPATRMVKVTDLSTWHARHYVGARVRKLQAIHRAEADRLFAACEAARDYDAFDAHCRRTVQNAIADALLHAALARSAACDKRALEGVG